MMEGIAQLISAPMALQRGQLAGKPLTVLLGAIAAPGLGFMVDEYRPRFVEGLPAPRVQLETEIDVIEGNREIDFIKAADLQKLLLTHDETGSGDGTDLLWQAIAKKITPVLVTQISMRVRGTAADARDNAGMLQRAIRVEQASADRTDVGAHCLADQQEEPIAVDHFDVIVEEAQVVASRMLNCSVVQRGKVEGPREPQDPRASSRYRAQIFEGFGIVAAVVSYDELYVRVARPADTIEASSKVGETIAGRHNDGDHRRSFGESLDGFGGHARLRPLSAVM